jgi:pimeloyl-ACP methyl ester carboxylesterase
MLLPAAVFLYHFFFSLWNDMDPLRKYGSPPFSIALLHGGPGARGEMSPVARELAAERGVLEPLQTAASVAGQLAELKFVLEKEADLPVTLAGFSWGAWLALLLAAEYPALVKKLVLIGCGPLEKTSAGDIEKARRERLSPEEWIELHELFGRLNEAPAGERGNLCARLGAILTRADSYEPLEDTEHELRFQPEIFFGVWPQAAALRNSGGLLRLAARIRCPVVAIHGDRDPHPAAGVEPPLSALLADFRFFLLPRCGHRPWMEKHARDEFFRILREALV